MYVFTPIRPHHIPIEAHHHACYILYHSKANYWCNKFILKYWGDHWMTPHYMYLHNFLKPYFYTKLGILCYQDWSTSSCHGLTLDCTPGQISRYLDRLSFPWPNLDNIGCQKNNENLLNTHVAFMDRWLLRTFSLIPRLIHLSLGTRLSRDHA